MKFPPVFQADNPALLQEWRDFFEPILKQFNQPGFIASDPVSIPHRYNRKEDIEIAGFLTALISWGNRISILKSAGRMMEKMGDEPYEFIMDTDEKKLRVLSGFVHRTFNDSDLQSCIIILNEIYTRHGGLETAFSDGKNAADRIHNFRNLFLSFPHERHFGKHLPDPYKGSAAKRINMFLRWMVRSDGNGVDFGLWKSWRPSELICPLDVHSGRIGRSLGLLERKQDDWKAALELTNNLRLLHPLDPVRYDYALFGMGIQPTLILEA